MVLLIYSSWLFLLQGFRVVDSVLFLHTEDVDETIEMSEDELSSLSSAHDDIKKYDSMEVNY